MTPGNANRRSPEFVKLFDKLDARVQSVARSTFEVFKKDPSAPQLHNKELQPCGNGRHVAGTRSVWVNYRYRALYVEVDGVNVWYWIGSHEQYNNYIGDK